MDNAVSTSLKCLQNTPYRVLQKTAKSLCLPANVKKVCLVELIVARQYKSPTEVERLVRAIKAQRAKAGRDRFMERQSHRIQEEEISSSSTRSPVVMRPRRRALRSYAPRERAHASINIVSHVGARTFNVLVFNNKKKHDVVDVTVEDDGRVVSDEAPSTPPRASCASEITHSEHTDNTNDNSAVVDATGTLEQVSECAEDPQSPGGQLPRIVDVFARFGAGRGGSAVDSHLTRPLYVQVSEEAERAQAFVQYCSTANTSLLEGLYNFKRVFITPENLVTVATDGRALTLQTEAVYSTPTVVTSMTHLPGVTGFDPDTQSIKLVESAMRAVGHFRPPALQDHPFAHRTSGNITHYDFVCTEVLSASESATPPPGMSIPEMVDDALELISQDGDYLERIGGDVHAQCPLCNWAGPRFMLDFHIRQEHCSEVWKQESNEWNMTYRVGSLASRNQQWLSRVAAYEDTLFVLSARYQGPHALLACLHVLECEEERSSRRGKMTVFNRVTGEPISWEGTIPLLPNTIPFGPEECLLDVPLAKLDLLPDSPSLLNRERESQLGEVHVTFFIELYK